MQDLMTDHFAYCRSQLKAINRPRYYACLFGFQECREDLIILWCFISELSRIQIQVSNPLISQMRLQYWRDVVQGEIINLDDDGDYLRASLLVLLRKHQNDGDRTSECLLELIDGYASQFEDISASTVNIMGLAHKLSYKVAGLELSPEKADLCSMAGQALTIYGDLLKKFELSDLEHLELLLNRSSTYLDDLTQIERSLFLPLLRLRTLLENWLKNPDKFMSNPQPFGSDFQILCHYIKLYIFGR